MQVHSQVLHDLQLQISSYLPTAMLQNDLRAHYTNKAKTWFLITQRAKADRIRQLQSSLQSPQLHSSTSRQPRTPCCQSHPLFDVPDSQLLQAPFTLLTGCCAMLYSLHTTHLDGGIHWFQWSTPGSHSRTPKSYCLYSEGRMFRHFHHEVETTGFQSRGPVLLPFWYKSESLLPTVPK